MCEAECLPVVQLGQGSLAKTIPGKSGALAESALRQSWLSSQDVNAVSLRKARTFKGSSRSVACIFLINWATKFSLSYKSVGLCQT